MQDFQRHPRLGVILGKSSCSWFACLLLLSFLAWIIPMTCAVSVHKEKIVSSENPQSSQPPSSLAAQETNSNGSIPMGRVTRGSSVSSADSAMGSVSSVASNSSAHRIVNFGSGDSSLRSFLASDRPLGNESTLGSDNSHRPLNLSSENSLPPPSPPLSPPPSPPLSPPPSPPLSTPPRKVLPDCLRIILCLNNSSRRTVREEMEEAAIRAASTMRLAIGFDQMLQAARDAAAISEDMLAAAKAAGSEEMFSAAEAALEASEAMFQAAAMAAAGCAMVAATRSAAAAKAMLKAASAAARASKVKQKKGNLMQRLIIVFPHNSVKEDPFLSSEEETLFMDTPDTERDLSSGNPPSSQSVEEDPILSSEEEPLSTDLPDPEEHDLSSGNPPSPQ